jgi:MYXO-CTERM domain-containing protein
VRLAAPAIAFFSLACVGCDGVQAPEARLGDTAPERTLLGPEIAAAFTFEQGWFVSERLAAPEGATRVGFFLDVAADAAHTDIPLEARGLAADGTPGAWRPAFFTWVEHPMRVGRVDLGGTAYGVEVRVAPDALESLAHLTFNAIVPANETHDPGFDALASQPTGPALAAAPKLQGLALSLPEPRSAWGARATQCSSQNATKMLISVHHTVTPTSESDYAQRLRGIQAFHMDTRGWCDVGYHFLVTSDGTTWEGRAAQYLGAHVGGNNTNNLGVSFVGCFHTSGCDSFPPNTPPEDMIAGGGALIGEAAAHYGITVNSSSVIGHRDNPGQTTSCPGDHLHARLPDLRTIASGGGTGGGDTGGGDTGGSDTTPPPATAGTVQGVVWDLAVTSDPTEANDLGAILPGTTITCDCGQSATARTGDAYWSLDLMPGLYTLTAEQDGYAPTSRQVQVTSGGSHWASIGVAPEAQVVQLSIFVHDEVSGAGLHNAYVEVTGHDPSVTDASGELLVPVAAGSVTIKAAAEGYEPLTLVREVSGGIAYVSVPLVPSLADETGDEPPTDQGETPSIGDEVPDQVAPPEALPPASSERARSSGDPALAQACACVASGDGDATDPTRVVALLLGLGLLLRRRKS